MTETRGPSVPAGFPIRGWLADCAPQFTRDLLSLARPKSFAAGSVIYQAGDVGGDVFGIGSGVVTLQCRFTRADAVVLHMAWPGEWFGTLSVLLERGRRITAVARTDVELQAVRTRESTDALTVYSPMTEKFQAFVFGVVPLVVAPITAILVTVLSKVAGHEAA